MQFNSTKTQFLWAILLILFLPTVVNAQQTEPLDSVLQSAPLDKVVQYALEHQPAIKQAEIDQEITNKIIKGKLADWYPQVNFVLNYQRLFDKQANIIGETLVRFGAYNSSSAQLSATQNVFNRDVLLASTTASKIRMQSSYNTVSAKIDMTVVVTKAFYDLLATEQQIKVNEESIARLEQSLKDAFSRYEAGVSDKTDYKRATILLSNAKATLKTNSELLRVKHEYLKTVIGYPTDHDLPIQYDTLQMETEIALDTTEQFNHVNHIAYKVMQTQHELQEANVKYSKWAFLPTLNLNANYNLNYQNDSFGSLYGTSYPYSFMGDRKSVV